MVSLGLGFYVLFHFGAISHIFLGLIGFYLVFFS